MPETGVARTLYTTPDTLWKCVRAFGDLSWIPGDLDVRVEGEGVGQVRIIARPHGAVHERLTSLDDAARTLTYTVPIGNPFSVTDYEATITISEDDGKGRIAWWCRFESDAASEEEIAKGVQERYRQMIRLIETHLRERR
jgi:hypothetical protein